MAEVSGEMAGENTGETLRETPAKSRAIAGKGGAVLEAVKA